MPLIYWHLLALDGESSTEHHVERVILLEAALRTNRVTTSGVTLPGGAGRRRPGTRSPEVEERHHCQRGLALLWSCPKPSK
jgi:hypothetical protein